jgi:hypothetical protein
MNHAELAQAISSIEGSNILVRCNPEILDFTNKDAQNELILSGQGGREVNFLLNDETLPAILGMLVASLFEADNKIIAWNWKSFASYVLGKTGKLLKVKASIIDLKVLESYVGIKNVAPKTLGEAMQRLKFLITGGLWREVESIYKNIHLPLSTSVLTHLEAIGILDTERGFKAHACYEIDGQQNGRLKCTEAFKRGFVPHAMTPALRESLKPLTFEQIFMSFDFRGMEVFVLAHLSKDENLLDLCKQKDIYTALYEKLTGKVSDRKEDRDFAKKAFLPVIYGMSAYALSQGCGVAIDVAEMVVERIGSLFPAAFAFVSQYESQVKQHGYAKDVFGKRRGGFKEGKEYLARNFAVQSPAATICAEKLIDLHFALHGKADIAYTIHDGYVVYATKDNWKQIYKICTDILTAESILCPGLRMKVSCRAGRNLNDLKPIGRKEH